MIADRAITWGRTAAWAMAVFWIGFGAKCFLIGHYGNDAPFLDQWHGELRSVFLPWVEGRMGLGDWFGIDNGHLMAPSRWWALLWLEANGLWEPRLQMLANAALHSAAGVLLFLALRTVTPEREGFLALIVAALLAVPCGWENTLWGYQSAPYFCVLFSVAAIWLFCQFRCGSGLWWLGWVFLALSSTSLGSGVLAGVAAAGVGFLQGMRDRASRNRSWWIALAALTLWTIVVLAVLLSQGTKGEGEWRSPLVIANTVAELLSWPLVQIPGAFLLIQAPALAALWWLLKGRKSSFSSPAWLGAGLALWSALHAFAAAFARGTGSSTFADFLAIGLAANLALLFWLAKEAKSSKARRPVFWLTVTWCLAAFAGLPLEFSRQQMDRFRSHLSLLQEQHQILAEYLETGDITRLEAHSSQDVPLFANAPALSELLNNPAARSLLPSALQSPLARGSVAPPEGFAPGQLAPGVCPPPHPVHWGSYDHTAGLSARGRMELRFSRHLRTPFVKIDVAGLPSPKGTSLIFSKPDGTSKTKLNFDSRPGDRWESRTLRLPGPEILLVAEDKFEDRWFAFTAPRAVGRLERQKLAILGAAPAFFASGAALMIALGLLQFGPKDFEIAEWLKQRGPRFAWWVVVALLTLGKLWLVAGQSVSAIGLAGHDDRLFLQLAEHLVQGNWLGPYNQVTLAKGPFYSFWIATMFWVGVPLLFSQQLFYTAACFILVRAWWPGLRHPWVALGIYGLLLWNPMSYDASALGRVLRQHVYSPLVLLIFAGLVALYYRRERPWICNLHWSALTGLALGAFWLTREEGIWIFPSLTLLAASFFCGAARLSTSRLLDVGRSVLAIVAGTLLPMLVVSAFNFHHYGWFGTVEFRAAEFKDAYGALQRVTAGPERQKIPVSRETREAIYTVSPSFTSLRPHLEGAIGHMWATVSEPVTGLPAVERQIGGGWMVWALRDAVHASGQAESAGEALAFYRRLAEEVNAACDAGQLPAGPLRTGFVPRLTADHVPQLAETFFRFAEFVVSFNGFSAHAPPSLGEGKSLILFRDLTQDRLSQAEEGESLVLPNQLERDAFRVSMLHQIGRAMGKVFMWLFCLALGVFLLRALHVISTRKCHFPFVLAAAAWVGGAVYLLLNALIEVTSYPIMAIHSFAPVYPLLALFIAAALIDGWQTWPRRFRLPTDPPEFDPMPSS